MACSSDDAQRALQRRPWRARTAPARSWRSVGRSRAMRRYSPGAAERWKTCRVVVPDAARRSRGWSREHRLRADQAQAVVRGRHCTSKPSRAALRLDRRAVGGEEHLVPALELPEVEAAAALRARVVAHDADAAALEALRARPGRGRATPRGSRPAASRRCPAAGATRQQKNTRRGGWATKLISQCCGIG